MPRFTTVALAAGAALLVRHAVRSRMSTAPLWPMPALDVPVSGFGRGSTVPRRVLVTGRSAPAEGVVELRLEGAGLPAWQPGAHVDLVLPSGLVRQYSLCGDPADPSSYTVATRLIEDGRGGSREVHEQLHEGTEIEIRGPRNRFPLVGAPAYAFVAGGIGITPVLPMVRAAEAAGADWRLVYCGRSRATMPYLDEVERLGGDRVTVVAEDESGFPELDFLAHVPAETAVYCCGPDGLMDAVGAAMPEGRAPRLERFSAAAPTGGTAFEVELRRSGRTVTVAADRTVLEAVREEVPGLMYSCRQGFCGTCRQQVLEGEVDHRDELLTDAERDDSMLICVSRCTGKRLVLDL
ncbi:Flavodoxin reductases (Ferredoxin-NADPH reductases) family 1 Vanillate O-demethylase oxidoreductase [Streptomyces venezuelae]|uniref:PDR/VanB family oxidoreductase n=1 Tax=Streptomyces gardneri TaxID=66892 RepID=UPI0006BD58AE|nr:PDR/VanB family oxidoreductase [Streptomyces gardneri]ALO07848.1 Flavodoxin reductases (Ferredoxin-NADPH reductases) family 1 Vanillate O-demethylase oxidoreductase [Streptomyces venezuelae]QPK45148.1 oxidoreductase [Streptomyces gardneri]WRK36464.1 PDR/VanB family oxidoreductase [Streptomyces venezuelae]CUM41816.1 Flavodoxin reductases (ferredoxin-NADPH reductases) family 1; Vanillate O-demethylase oxidoreductase [Streptomyces venezuelae]